MNKNISGYILHSLNSFTPLAMCSPHDLAIVWNVVLCQTLFHGLTRSMQTIDLFNLFDTLTITAIYYFHYGFFSIFYFLVPFFSAFLSPVPCTACVYVLFVYSHYHVYYFSCVVCADGVSKCAVRKQIILHSL